MGFNSAFKGLKKDNSTRNKAKPEGPEKQLTI